MASLRIIVAVLTGLGLFNIVRAGNDTLRARRSRQWSSYDLGSLAISSNLDRKECPPCFNCLLPAFTCGQYGDCDPYDGQCKCPPGWGGIDCLTPQCDSLADGEKRRLREEGKECVCKDGWGGINCNVCETDAACVGFPLAGQPVEDEDSPVSNMTCYTSARLVIENHQMCDVTNRKIVDQLAGEKPEVTFSCNKNSSTCTFQFWIALQESFYCALDTCKSSFEAGFDANVTKYECEHLKCKCVPGRKLCGWGDFVDLTDFLAEEIKGPASFSCRTGQGCRFEEPAMNDLINTVFGDNHIKLDCHSGECLHYSQVPGYQPLPKPDYTKALALSAAGAGALVLLAFAGLWYMGRSRPAGIGKIRLPENEAASLMKDHVPTTLHFSEITYSMNSRAILSGVSGAVKPGQVLAIMGASGAGKTTLLDILALKSKRGATSGNVLVNGREIEDSEYKRVIGFVDQEDTLMSTLTVYETVLNSALLRLPREMSLEAKKYRTLETLQELGILGIKDSMIGDSSRRSISGGEKRRVSIACELVTSPSILFLDEPTSGLDAFNAYNVVDSLVSLAKDYNRAVIFTIHQPRSNIVAMFDQLVLLARGKTVYSGDHRRCHDYLERIGAPCPPGFNLADYLLDITVSTDLHSSKTNGGTFAGALQGGDVEQGQTGSSQSSEDTELQSGNFVKRKASALLDALSLSSRHTSSTPLLHPRLEELVQAYEKSDIRAELLSEIQASQNGAGQSASDLSNSLSGGRKSASWLTQFRILSGRAFKNLYRNPALLAAHYISSIALALICGFLYRNVTNDLSGFQNRLGVFFFALALFGFSGLSIVGLFASERLLYMRERSNGYYSSATYFTSKVLFDILPLRIVPPLVFGAIVYPLVGLVPEVATFWKFMLILVSFNLVTATLVLLVSVAFELTSVANLVGTLIMLYNLLFTGLLISRETLPHYLQWLFTLSFFHAAFEALAVNELRYLSLKEVKYGVSIDVPAATILSVFGLNAQSFWWPNTALLGIFFAGFTALSYLLLHFHVRERR